MNGTFWKGALAYLMPTFPLGYLWHLVIFRREYESLGLYRSEVIIPMGLSAMTIQAVIFSWAYPRLFSTAGSEWASSAARAWLVFGLLSWSFTTLPVAAKYSMASVPLFMALETGFTAIQYAMVAPLLALAARRSREG